ncbi:MAG: hypothetical protein ACOC44_19885 [Promethearchaeia archaeon]
MDKIYLILLVILPLFVFGQNSDDPRVKYQKVEFAAVREDSLSDFQEIDANIIRFYEKDRILEVENSEGEKYRWLVIKEVSSEFDDSGLTEDGSTRYYFEADRMQSGKRLLLEMIEDSETATWILWHGNENGKTTIFAAKKLN